jgi:thioredoxin reductase (NADPH)
MGVHFKLTDVRRLELTGQEKVVETFGNKYLAKTVILATGGRNRLSGAANEEDFLFGRGISLCGTCDAAANTGKHVLVIGSGDAAIKESLYLAKFARRVTVSVMHDQGKMDCNKIDKKAALANEKIRFIWNSLVDRFEGQQDCLKTVVLKNTKTGDLIPVNCDACFEFIGYIPNTELLEGQVDMTEDKYILTNDKMETNLPGVFAAGDVREKWLRQIATAVGDGAIAGTAAERYIAETETFEKQIMQAARPGLIYLYNANDPNSLSFFQTIEKIEEEAAGALAVHRIDVSKSKGLADRLNVKTFPALLTTKGGRIDRRLLGSLTEASIKAALDL